jgi:hypothetical protein
MQPVVRAATVAAGRVRLLAGAGEAHACKQRDDEGDPSTPAIRALRRMRVHRSPSFVMHACIAEY